MTCPICQKELAREKAKRLYDVPVCRACSRDFARRRQRAFLLDLLLLYVVWVTVAFRLTKISVLASDTIIRSILLAILILFSLKDGFAGRSPGKAIYGIRIVDRHSLEPIGPGRSFLRNGPILIILCLSVLFHWIIRLISQVFPAIWPPGFLISNSGLLVTCAGLLIIGGILIRGPRWGDGLARTKVIWDRYRYQPPFDMRGLVCLKCGYNLTGNVSGVCPECGTLIDRRIREDVGAGVDTASENP